MTQTTKTSTSIDRALVLALSDREARATAARNELASAVSGIAMWVASVATAVADSAKPGAEQIDVDHDGLAKLVAAGLIEGSMVESLVRWTRDVAALRSVVGTSAPEPVERHAQPEQTAQSKAENPIRAAQLAREANAKAKKAGALPILRLEGVARTNYYSARKLAQTAAEQAGLADLAVRIGAAKNMVEVRTLAAEGFTVEVAS